MKFFTIMIKTMPMFGNVFRRYDDLNSSVQENVTAIRVVKAFVREDYEKVKFARPNAELKDAALRALSVVITMMPLMMLLMNIGWKR